jgi:hypothetical protein
MKFVLLLYGDEARWAEMSPEAMEESVEVWNAFGRELVEAGAHVAGEGLEPTPSAVTVRYENGELVRTDGPFAETREQLGGFFVLECKDIEEALQWAAKVPDLPEDGSVEVRPVMDYEAYGYDVSPEAAKNSRA